MTNKILVAYASKYGATSEIAEKIGDVLRRARFDVDVLPADQVDSLTCYDGVVLGSAIYAGQWRREAVLLLETFEHELSKMPVWFFSSGPTGEGDPLELIKGWEFPEPHQTIANRVHPRQTVIFHGAIDMEKLNFGDKLLVQRFNAHVGDYRDWSVIREWAVGIADMLKEEIANPA